MPKPMPKNDFSDLERIYRESTGSNDTLGNLQRPSTSRWKKFLMIIFFILALGSLAAWSGFYLFNSLGKDQPGELRLEIIAPEAVSIGEPVEYRVRLTNVSTADVNEVNLRLNYPAGFMWKNATLTPQSSSHNIWNLGTIVSGGGKEILVQGAIFGESGGVKTVFGVATYHLANFRSELEVSVSAGSRLDEALFKISLTGPTASAPGETATYEIKYEHEGTMELPESVLTVVLSPNFKVGSVSPAALIDSNYQWNLSTLLPKSSDTISVIGAWANEAAGEETIAARLETKSDTGALLKIAFGSMATRVSNGAMILSMKVNDSVLPAAVNLGDQLSYVLEYENTSDSTIEEAKARVAFGSELIDWDKVSAEDDGKVDNRSVVWESERTPALVKILPKARGFLRWTMPIVKSLPSLTSALEIVGTPTLSYKKLDGELAARIFDGAPLTVNVNGPISLEVEARYFNDASRPVGSGPIPPKAGLATIYQITWRVRGSSHELKNVRVKAELPAEVAATGNKAVMEIGSWNINDDGSPEWTIDSLAPSLEPSLSFTIELKPTNDDIGKVLALSVKTVLSAVDNVTQGNVTAIGNVVTTNLETDPVARGQGVVVK